jgi:hypothetical protein
MLFIKEFQEVLRIENLDAVTSNRIGIIRFLNRLLCRILIAF